MSHKSKKTWGLNKKKDISNLAIPEIGQGGNLMVQGTFKDKTGNPIAFVSAQLYAIHSLYRLQFRPDSNYRCRQQNSRSYSDQLTINLIEK